MVKAFDSLEKVTSKIPGHKHVVENEEKVETFIALVADMRQSSQHLLCAISADKADVSELKRVYYETSALLPALERTIQFEGGSTTEYLGDGILSLFLVDDNDKDTAMYAAYHAADNCINASLPIVNRELATRYKLPSLKIGIGLGMSKALISLVGLEGQKHAKAIGRCVYNATKLSEGSNEIYADEYLDREWPTSAGGKLRFSSRETKSGFKGFLLSSK